MAEERWPVKVRRLDCVISIQGHGSSIYPVSVFSNLVGEEGTRVRGVKGPSDCSQGLLSLFLAIPLYLLHRAESQLIPDSPVPRYEAHSMLLAMSFAFPHPLHSNDWCGRYDFWRTV